MTTIPVDSQSDEHDADDILAELEAESEADLLYQKQRAEELAGKSSGIPGNGYIPTIKQDNYITIKSDDETLRFTTEHERALVHFFHSDFARCSIMDDHLQMIADRHGVHGGSEASGEEVAIGRVNVSDAHFVVEKLSVRVLPCVVGFAKGIAKGRVVGFEGVCWDNREKDVKVTKALEEQMVAWGVLKQRLFAEDAGSDDSEAEATHQKKQQKNGRRGIRDRNFNANDDDDDWD